MTSYPFWVEWVKCKCTWEFLGVTPYRRTSVLCESCCIFRDWPCKR